MNKKQIRTTHSLRVFGSDHTDLVHSTGVAPLAARRIRISLNNGHPLFIRMR